MAKTARPSPQVQATDYYPPEDARTLMNAEAIKGDKKRHGAAIAHAQKQAAQIQKIVPQKPAGRSKGKGGR
ncbi:MAG TPA: hypothetical protein V6D22_16950 [Candidatus Obscuribacterales bacterium]